MKTRVLLALAIAAVTPFAFVAGCSSDDSSQTDGGPQNEAGGKDVTTDNAQPQPDSGTDGANQCTGPVFDNGLVPGFPNNIPQP